MRSRGFQFGKNKILFRFILFLENTCPIKMKMNKFNKLKQATKKKKKKKSAFILQLSKWNYWGCFYFFNGFLNCCVFVWVFCFCFVCLGFLFVCGGCFSFLFFFFVCFFFVLLNWNVFDVKMATQSVQNKTKKLFHFWGLVFSNYLTIFK